MGTLTNDLNKFTKLSMEKAEKVVQASLLTMGGRIIKDSPVKDGFFRNSWMSAWGAIDGSTRNEDTTGSASSKDLTQTIEVVQFDTEMFFTNSMPYAAKLEFDGHSAQAPNGVVRVNTLDWENVVTKNIKRFGQ